MLFSAEPGFVIRVDFRDEFNIEPHHQCLYDFLEVRDGAHGYSTLIGRFCGKSFPPVINSSDRFLWLRFSTDDNIEYAGFRAVYQFVPDSGKIKIVSTCTIHKKIRSNRSRQFYRSADMTPITCCSTQETGPGSLPF